MDLYIHKDDVRERIKHEEENNHDMFQEDWTTMLDELSGDIIPKIGTVGVGDFIGEDSVICSSHSI